MISSNFINSGGIDPLDRIMYPCIEFLESVDEEISKITSSYYCNKSMFALESEIMDRPNESLMVVLEEEKKNVVEKLGSLIINIFKKAIETIKKFGDWVKNLGFKNKSDLDKLDKLCAEHPDLKDEIIASFKNGELNLSDVRSLKELDEAYDQILKMSQDEKNSPKTLREKWKAAVDKYDANNSKIVKAGKVAGGVTAVVTAGIAVYTIKQKMKEANLRCVESENELAKRQRATYDALKKEGVINDTTGRAETMTAISRELAGKHSAATKQNLSVIQKLQNGIDSLIDKADKKFSNVTGDKTDAFHKDMKYGLNKDAQDKKAEQDKIRETARLQAEGRRDSDKLHEGEDHTRKVSDAKAVATAQAEAKRKVDKEHEKEDIEKASRMAKAEAEAKKAVNDSNKNKN